MIDIIPNWHPIFVHFSVVFIVITGLLQLQLWLFSSAAQQAQIAVLKKWLLGVAVLAVLATVATGLQAYYSVAHDSAAHIAMTNHRNWALATALVFVTGTLLYFLLAEPRQLVSGSLFVTALVMVSVTAFKGGDLVYRHGLGIMSLPAAAADGHEHQHGEHDHTDQEHDSQEQNPGAGAAPAQAEHSHGSGSAHQLVDNNEPALLESGPAKAAADFHRALNSGDSERVLLLLHDAVLIYEGGAVERSAQQYANHHMQADIDFLTQMQTKRLEHQLEVFGDTALATARTQISGEYKGKKIDMVSMETLILRRQADASWKIVHIHWSN